MRRRACESRGPGRIRSTDEKVRLWRLRYSRAGRRIQLSEASSSRGKASARMTAESELKINPSLKPCTVAHRDGEQSAKALIIAIDPPSSRPIMRPDATDDVQ
jgi:hypothetical protein